MQETQETRVRSLGWEDPWKKPWKPTAAFLPGESHGQRSLVCYSPWSRKESDTTEATEHLHTDEWDAFTVCAFSCWHVLSLGPESGAEPREGNNTTAGAPTGHLCFLPQSSHLPPRSPSPCCGWVPLGCLLLTAIPSFALQLGNRLS